MNSISTLPISFWLLAIGVIVLAPIVGYIGGKTSARIHLRALERRLANAELDGSDLKDRFQRFQNRENMRKAREEKETQTSLEEEARSILGTGYTPGAATPIGDKAALKRQLRSRK